MSSSNLVRLAYKKEVSYGVTPASVPATLVLQDLTYTAAKGGTPGNSITIQYTNTATAGAETCMVTGNAIVIGIQSGTSTATQVKAKFDITAAATALASVAISGTGGTAQVTAGATALASGSGEFNTARFISEKYSGSPETTASQQIRTDRQSSGQVVTGLTVGGGHSIELAKELAIEDFMESAMFSSWTTMSTQTRALTISVSGKTITAVSGSFVTDGLKVGDFIKLTGFTSSLNNVVVMVTSVATLILGFAGPDTMIDGTGGATAYKRADRLDIGIAKHSLSIEKSFLDLTTKAINYRGMLVSEMDLKIAYGSLISGSFDLSGNGYVAVDTAAAFETYGSYISSPASTDSLNGSIDMPFVATDVTGTFDTGNFCIQSLDLKLSNNLTTQTCIGRIAPENYNPGTATVAVSLSSYLKDGNWDLLTRKLTQDSFALGFLVSNSSGGYGFWMPAIQVSFDDPASGGANQDISMDMSGQAKVGSNGESELTLYRF